MQAKLAFIRMISIHHLLAFFNLSLLNFNGPELPSKLTGTTNYCTYYRVLSNPFRSIPAMNGCRCFFIHLGVAIQVHPFALQTAFRSISSRILQKNSNGNERCTDIIIIVYFILSYCYYNSVLVDGLVISDTNFVTSSSS